MTKKALYEYKTKEEVLISRTTTMINTLAKIDKIKDFALKQSAIQEVNKEYGLKIPIYTEHPDVEHFFELINFIEDEGMKINHEITGIAINLNEFYLAAKNLGQILPMKAELMSRLKNSPRYITNKVIKSKVNGGAKRKSVRCWLFKEAP